MKKRTINEAILEVFKRVGKPLSIKEIYDKIIEYDLYRFRSQNPQDIVRIQLRRHCFELDFPTASAKKIFTVNKEGAFYKFEKKGTQLQLIKKDNTSTFNDLKELHKKYVFNFKRDVLKWKRQSN